MASRYRWRQQLLGSLQGQLQLATYLVVFLGFTGASSVGLLIGQHHLLANDQQMVLTKYRALRQSHPWPARRSELIRPMGMEGGDQLPPPSLSFSTAMKASWGTSTLPMAFIRFLPLACFFSNFFFREMSPP